MYKHILLPTDGSELSRKAAQAALRLAAAVGAQVTAVHVTPKLTATALDQWAARDGNRRARLGAIFDEQAKRYLSEIETAAAQAGVPCASVQVAGDAPHVQILKVAAQQGCDLVYMASHGMHGESALLLGSETAKVLTHSPIPVLVHRDRARVAAATHVEAGA